MSLYDSKAFSDSLGAWIGRATQQIRDIDAKLDQYRTATFEMNDDLHALTTTVATLSVTIGNLSNQVQALSNRVEQIDARNAGAIASGVEQVNQAQRIKALEANQSKVVWAIVSVFIAGVAGMVLSFSRVEYQLQHPSVPRSQSPATSSPKL